MTNVWNLDKEKDYNSLDRNQFFAKNGYDKNTHKDFKIGDVVTFMTGFNNHIPAQAKIKGINGNDIYVYNDCYWFPVKAEILTKVS